MENLRKTVSYLESKGVNKPEIGIVLGTGLGNMINHINITVSINYEEIPSFPVSTVESHKGKLIFGTLAGKKVLAMQGRFHYYEGYTFKELTLPIRVMKLLGVELLLLSNACGSMNPNFKKASLMVIDDHIDLLPGNPLTGKNFDEMGERFPDMSQPYNREINILFHEIAKEKKIQLNEGVYVAVAGPNLETRAEYRFLRLIGADVVGMSTVPEVIVANQIGLKCAAISVITDECDPDNLQIAEIKEILSNAAQAEPDLIELFRAFITSVNLSKKFPLSR
jgi:purine-nucleoside phosphorylase